MVEGGKPLKAYRKTLTVLPEIRRLIDVSRQHVVSTANLALVSLYWNIGRVITQDIQRTRRRADYGDDLLNRLATELIREYGAGFSRSNLQDMRRFFESFEIRQPVAGNSVSPKICQPPAGKSAPKGLTQTASKESSDRLLVDFERDTQLGWTHYRILLSISDLTKRRFYFERAIAERWSKRELQRQIDRALFERAALSPDTHKLARIEKQTGPAETVRYEDAFKDPYLLDFLGLKGAYSENDLEAAIIANLQQFLTELGSDSSVRPRSASTWSCCSRMGHIDCRYPNTSSSCPIKKSWNNGSNCTAASWPRKTNER